MEDKAVVKQEGIASEFLYQIIKPAIRILMRLGYSARNASDLIRWAYVKVFYETPEFWRYESPTALQCALKTGMTRTEIPALLQIASPRGTEREGRRNRAARILYAWGNDPEYQRNGKPLELPVEGDSPQAFRNLVGRYEIDARYQSVLHDLLAVGCVEQLDGRLRLVRPTYGMEGMDSEKLGLAGDMVSNLLTTTEHNLKKENAATRRLQRFWWQRAIPIERAQEAHDLVKRLGEEYGRKIDKALEQLADKSDDNVECIEIGVAIFGYERANEIDIVGRATKRRKHREQTT